ncbi:MAG: hypothetical protein MR512_07490 [Anaerococcus sp.]|nr:hypothetical protein [Anaerococcus sp.]
MSKKKSKLRIASALLAFAMVAPVIPQMAPVTSYAEVEPANWVDDEQTQRYWPIPHQGKLVKVSSADPLKNPSVEYVGTYTRPDGREVVRLSFSVYAGATSAVWEKLIIKPDAELANMIDWNLSGMGKGRPTQATTFHDTDRLNEKFVGFENPSDSQSGSGNTYAMDMTEKGTQAVKTTLIGPWGQESPIDLVLKEGQSVRNLKNNPLIQARLMDKEYERIYSTTTAEAEEVPYSSYTFSTFIPVRVNLGEGTLMTDVVRNYENIFKSASATMRYNEEEGYIDVYSKRTNGSIGAFADNGGSFNGGDSRNRGFYAFRQSFDASFKDILKPQGESKVVAQVFVANPDDTITYPDATKKSAKADSRLDISEDGVFLKDGIGYIQVADNKWPTDYKLDVSATTTAPNKTFLPSGVNLTGYGYSTVVRYFVDKDKLKEKFGDSDVVAYEFFSTLLASNETGVEQFSAPERDEDIDLKRGDKITLRFDGKRDLITKGTFDTQGSYIQIGDDQFAIDIRTTADKAKYIGGGLVWDDNYMKVMEVTVPFDIKIKKDTPVTVYSRKTKLQEVSPGMTVTFNYSTQDNSGNTVKKDKTYRFERPLVEGYTRNEKGEIFKDGIKINEPQDSLFIDNHDPLVRPKQATHAGGILTRTADAPDIDEIFTDSENLTGRSKYDRVYVYPYDADKQKVETAKRLGTIEASDKKIPMNVNGDGVQGYEWTSETNDAAHKIDSSNWANKDMPIYFTNQDVLANSLENEVPVVEQVQAKVNFDLNGGTLPLKVKSYQGIDKEKLPGTEFAYVVKRSQETENVTRIAPMNEKFANQEGYTPNGFEGNGVTYKEHNGEDLEGDALELRKFIAEEPKKADTQFLGWTTKKLEGTPEEVKKSFDELEEATTADQVNGGENYKFIKTSPITKETTVYAAYGLIESAVYNPEQKYDEATDKQYIEAKPAEDGKEAPAATQKLVKKTGEESEGKPTYEEIDVPVTNIGGKDVFDITGEDSPVKDGDEIYIKTEEDGKPASYSTTPVVVDKKAPTLTSSDDDIVQDAYGYQAKVAASAEDTSGILRVYIDEDKENGYSNPEANEEQASLDAQLLKQRNQAKEYKITAIDKFGNKTVLENTLEVKQERVDLYLDNAYDGDDYVIAKSEAGASIEVKVDGKVVKTEQASGDYQEIILDSELAADQTIELTATIDGKQSRTIVIKVRN